MITVNDQIANSIWKIFEGDDTRRGVIKYWNKETGKKDARQEKRPIDFLSHLRGETIQGLSPVNLKHNAVRWICLDIDEKIDPKIFCSKLWIYSRDLIPFMSLNGRWHVYKFFDSWFDVNEAKKEAKKIESDLINLGLKVDKTHTLPTGWSVENDSPGSWIFLPYADKNVCYSPKGNPLTIEQFLFRHKYKAYPLIAGAVGMNAEDGRHKALFNAAMEQKWNEVGIELEDLNSHFTDPIKSQKEIENAKGVEEYDETHFNKNYNNYLSELCNDDFPFEKKEEVEKPKRKPGIVSFKFNEFCQRKYPPTIYQMYPFFSNECIGLGWSLPGVGKSLLTFDLTFHLSQGKSFLHWNHLSPDDPMGVLYVEFEMASGQLQSRALEIADREGFKINENNFRVATLSDQPHGQYRPLTTKEGREDIELTAKEMFEETGKKPLIVIDNIRFSMGDFDEKEGKNWIPLVQWCAEMRARGYSVLYLHHAVNTGEKFSGSGYANSNVNFEFMLRLPKEEEMHPEYDLENYTQFVFKFNKMRENAIGAMTPILIVCCKKTHKWFKFPILTKTERQIQKLLDQNMDVESIVKYGDSKKLDGFSRSNVFKLKKKLGGKNETDKQTAY